jgi:outer membrane lipoprotein LolB
LTVLRRFSTLAAAGILLLSGCALPPPPLGRLSAGTFRQLRSIQGFEITGVLGVVDRQRGFSGSFYWRNRQGRTLLIVTAPLGTGGFRLTGHPGHWRLVTSRGRVLPARHCLRCVLAHWFAVPVPIRSLRYWVRGLPDPRAPARQSRDSEGRLQSLVQDDWRLVFERYGHVDGLPVPTHLLLQYRSAKIHLIVDRWTIWRAPGSSPR